MRVEALQLDFAGLEVAGFRGWVQGVREGLPVRRKRSRRSRIATAVKLSLSRFRFLKRLKPGMAT